MAMTKCNEALEFDENNVDALCDRAEMYILQDMFEEGELCLFVVGYGVPGLFDCFYSYS